MFSSPETSDMKPGWCFLQCLVQCLLPVHLDEQRVSFGDSLHVRRQHVVSEQLHVRRSSEVAANCRRFNAIFSAKYTQTPSVRRLRTCAPEVLLLHRRKRSPKLLIRRRWFRNLSVFFSSTAV